MKAILSLVFSFSLIVINAQSRLSEVVSYKDVVYKTQDSVQHKLDIYLPESSGKKSPVLVFIHGGGWVEDDKALPEGTYPHDFVLAFVKNGYAVVSINYTLVSKSRHFPQPVEDCKEAVRWIRANADAYHLDPDNIGVWGASAGGQLALLLGYTGDGEFAANSNLTAYSSKVNYVIDYFGPSEMNQLFRTRASFFTLLLFKLFLPKIYEVRSQLVFALTGLSIKDHKKEVINTLDRYSPIRYVSSSSVPTLMIHGTSDKVVPYRQSVLLQKQLNKYQIENELIPIPSGDHGLNDVPEHAMMLEKTLRFMKAHTHPAF